MRPGAVSSMKSATAIAFDYRPSRWVLVAILVITALALLAVALSGLPAWAKVGLCAVAAGIAGSALTRFLRPQIKCVAWQPGGHWRASNGNGNEYVVELHRAVARGAWIVLILRRSDGKRLVLILGPDNCDADTRRRLRVRLAGAEVQA